MGGTGARLPQGGGLFIPTPRVVRNPKGVDAGSHDILSVGWMQEAEFEALKERKPEIWLFRGKRGLSANKLPNTGYSYAGHSGLRHPSDTMAGALSGRCYSGGAHNARSGATIGPRPSEWPVTKPFTYNAQFDASVWFLDTSNKPYGWPIQPLNSGAQNESFRLGQNGQGFENVGSFNTLNPITCGKARGNQVQYFAFAFAVIDENDPRNRIIGPMTKEYRAEIWPKVRTYYNCPPRSARGKKVRIIEA